MLIEFKHKDKEFNHPNDFFWFLINGFKLINVDKFEQSVIATKSNHIYLKAYSINTQEELDEFKSSIEDEFVQYYVYNEHNPTPFNRRKMLNKLGDEFANLDPIIFKPLPTSNTDEF